MEGGTGCFSITRYGSSDISFPVSIDFITSAVSFPLVFSNLIATSSFPMSTELSSSSSFAT